MERENSLYADREQKEEDYQAALKEQRKRLAKEDERTSIPRRKYEHEGHKKFGAFYRSLGDQRDSFLHLSMEEREKIFTQWLEDRRKTA